ncbi:MAG: AI-2E family transporter [Nitrospirales bacterium]|nr:AI-2E family transporter [Nitrospirales bacterium]
MSDSSRSNPGLPSELFRGPINIRSIALTGLFLYASLYILDVAKTIILPIFVALILSLLLGPILRALKRVWIPEPLGAGVILIVFIVGLGFGIVQLATPASVWLERIPDAVQQAEEKFRSIRHSVVEMGKVTEALEQVTSLPDNQRAREIEVNTNSLGGLLVGWTTEFIFGLVSTLILLYFFLASGNLFLEKLVKVLPRFSDKRRAVEIVRGIEGNISTYLLTVTGVNIGLALTVSAAMYMLGMPNPFLWGAMAGILNYVPYVGSFFGVTAITLAAAFSFDHINVIVLVSGSYLLLTVLEGNVITPMLLGRGLLLNPVVILMSVFFWGWLWGPVGALLAVPFVASMKIICDQIEPLQSIGEFLGK